MQGSLSYLDKRLIVNLNSILVYELPIFLIEKRTEIACSVM